MDLLNLRGGYVPAPPPAFAKNKYRRAKAKPYTKGKKNTYSRKESSSTMKARAAKAAAGRSAAKAAREAKASKPVTLTEFQRISKIVRKQVLTTMSESMQNGLLQNILIGTAMSYYDSKLSSLNGTAATPPLKVNNSPSTWNQQIPLGVNRKYTMIFGDERKMPSSSVANEEKTVIFRSDSVTTADDWQSSDASITQRGGLNERMVQFFPTELPEMCMRMQSAFYGPNFNNFNYSHAQRLFDSPAEDASSGDYLLGMTRQRYMPFSMDNNYYLTNENTYLECEFKLTVVQGKMDDVFNTVDGKTNIQPYESMRKCISSMELYDTIPGTSEDVDMFYGSSIPGTPSNAFPYILRGAPRTWLKKTKTLEQAPLFDSRFRVLKRMNILNVKPFESVHIHLKSFQNVNFTKFGDLSNYDSENSLTLEKYSTRQMFLIVETIGKADVPCYRKNGPDSITRDLRSGPSNVSVKFDMSICKYKLPAVLNNVTEGAVFYSTYIKEYETFEQQTNVSVIGSTRPANIALNNEDALIGDFIVPTLSEVTVTSARPIEKATSTPM